MTYSSGNLVWYYFQQGDYDQNGEVNIADLTPLGANFGTAGPFSWQDAISCVDGDNNGELNIADVTPIGINFGNRMEGYHIYQSTSQVDYPTSNVAPNGPDAVQTLAEPLSAAITAAGKRSYFSAVYPPMTPGDHVWARPYLAAAEGTPSNLYSPGGVWHVVVVAQGEPESCTGAYCSLALIGGRPAIACTADDTPVFVRAADAHGDAWGAPVGIAPLVTTASLTSLASINGVPGIAFNESAQGPIVYTQAPDAAGVTWSEPMEVDQDWPDHALSLAEVNLRAAVAYDKVPHMPGPDELWYERSGNNANTDWASLSTLVCPNVANYASLAVFSGNPAITFTDSTNGLLYVYSTDVNGSVWSNPVVVEDHLDWMQVGLRPCLALMSDRPAICYQVAEMPGRTVPYFARASDPQGAGPWTEPAPLSLDARNPCNSGAWTAMTTTASGSFVAYYDASNGQLRCTTAVTYNTWYAAEVVDAGGGNNVGQYCSMADVNGHPGIAYYDADAEALKYTVLY